MARPSGSPSSGDGFGEGPRLARVGGSGQRPLWLIALGIVFVAAAIAKPWSIGSTEGQPAATALTEESARPVVAAPETERARPAAVTATATEVSQATPSPVSFASPTPATSPRSPNAVECRDPEG